MIATGLSLTAMYVAARELSPEIFTFQIVFLRTFFTLVLLLPWLVRSGFGALRTAHPWLHGLRGVSSFLAVTFMFYGVANAPLADATALQAVYPLFTIVLAMIVLAERPGPGRWLATITGFAGLLIIVRPGFEEVGLATLSLLACSLFYAISNIAVKLVARADPATMMVFSVNAYIVLLSAIPAAFVWVMPTWPMAPWIGLLATSGFGAQYCLTRALASGDASVVMPLDYLRLPFAAIVGFWVYMEVPDLLTVIGAAIIVASVSYIAVAEANQRAKPPANG
jgi:drug/metabolite transporter (DMT)-like permease